MKKARKSSDNTWFYKALIGILGVAMGIMVTIMIFFLNGFMVTFNQMHEQVKITSQEVIEIKVKVDYIEAYIENDIRTN